MTGAPDTTARYRLSGRISVRLPPADAFRLFTPRGEQDWAHHWFPRFPVPVIDDSEPGTVFETHAHGHRAVWVVTGREPGRRISYSRVIPGGSAGTVTVILSPSGEYSQAEVIYEITALTPEASAELRNFAEGYPAYLRSWQDEIEHALSR